MKHLRNLFFAVMVTLIGMVGAVDPARAGPIGTGLSVSILPTELVPGQAGFVFVLGDYPLEIDARLDGVPLEMMWAGKGYVATFSFDRYHEPAEYTLIVTVRNPLTGERLTREETIRVIDYSYPLEDIIIGPYLSSLLDQALNEEENALIRSLTEEISRPGRWDWPFYLPAPGGAVTSNYGASRIYNNGALRTYHTGTDYRRYVGDPVVAAAFGQVVAVETFHVRGITIVLNHGYGVYSLYAHLSESLVQPGQVVHQGEIIGRAGSTGRSLGPHLHYELIVKGVQVDSLRWMTLVPGFEPPPMVEPIPQEESDQTEETGDASGD
nr:M23 family metallopeptidase [Anaerolineae bacterium]